ncbi:MMPL family transporter [Conexibacter sp. SYSU D00693]|uniref:MMPL family transporter n=1 Tax=Conexibacter sp. SYSU D00693 TaxID=2812560 RepID=UPI00196B80BC|nr:MMPL family transporter [Conexibacter sp. SYSU D00693]
MVDRVAELTWRAPKRVLAVVALLAALAGAIGHDVEHHLKAAGFTDSASESERASGILRGALGFDATPAIIAVVREPGGGPLRLDDPRVRRDVADVAERLRRTRFVAQVDDPLREPQRFAALRARDGRSIVLAVHLSTQDVEDEGGLAAEDAAKRLEGTRLRVELGGFAPSFNQVNDQTREDLTNAEVIAFPALAILLLLVFRGVVAAAIPLLIGVLSILGTFLVLRTMSAIVDTSLFALNIATALSLGLAVDYALLMVSRFREEVAARGPTREAHLQTVRTAGRAALFSGLTVAAAMAALVVMPQRFLYSIGVAGAAVGVMSALMALFVVPALLRLAGGRIDALAVRRGPAVSSDSSGWHRLARGVMRRPVAVALVSVGLLVGAAAPLAGTVLTGPSAEAVPDTQPSYDANAYVERHYVRDLVEGATVVVRGAADDAALERFGAQMRAVDGVARVSPFQRASGEVAYASVGLRDRALHGPAQDAIRTVRDLSPPDGADVLVAGNTARFIDQKASLVEHAPLVVAIISVTIFVLIFLLTGSVVLPIKTLLMNGLTLAATLGVMVLGFQEGWLDGALAYEGPAAIEVTSLVFLFAVTFGLATDYAVLVLARIKEQHDLGKGDEEAVAIGIGRTGRVISAAAVMIAVVFLAFAVSPVFFMKEIAVGMAVGVLVDATIVRALLVPSLMRLLGRWNWWAPAPLRRLQARFALQEA